MIHYSCNQCGSSEGCESISMPYEYSTLGYVEVKCKRYRFMFSLELCEKCKGNMLIAIHLLRIPEDVDGALGVIVYLEKHKIPYRKDKDDGGGLFLLTSYADHYDFAKSTISEDRLKRTLLNQEV